VEGLREEWR